MCIRDSFLQKADARVETCKRQVLHAACRCEQATAAVRVAEGKLRDAKRTAQEAQVHHDEL